MKYSIYSSTLMVIVLFFITIACESDSDMADNQPLVAVGEKQLTNGMLYSAIPNNLSDEDSIVFAQDYINRWIRSELLLKKAELNLSPQEKDVDKMLEEYRRSLLVHQYQQKLLAQKFSPLITGTEVKTCYEEMSDNFLLKDPIIKGLFLMIPKTAPNISTVERLYKSDEQEDLVKLETYCFQNAKKYEVFLDQWLPLSDINKTLPEAISRPEQFVRYNKHYQTSDSLHHYFLAIQDFKLGSELAPIEYVEERIKAILVNKKRLEFIKQLETDLYEEGLKNKSIKFY